jgi:hypothetical protein
MNSIVTTKAASQAIMWFFEKKTTTVYKSLGGWKKTYGQTAHIAQNLYCAFSSSTSAIFFHILYMEKCNEKKWETPQLGQASRLKRHHTRCGYLYIWSV